MHKPNVYALLVVEKQLVCVCVCMCALIVNANEES